MNKRIAKKIRKGMLDFDVRNWTLRTLHRAWRIELKALFKGEAWATPKSE